MIHAPPREPASRTPKTVLFCPNCGHESPLDGDWVGDEPSARHRLSCPNCGDCVVDRPR